jgi:hypothetical protein
MDKTMNRLSIITSSIIFSTSISFAQDSFSADGNFRAGFISDKSGSDKSQETLSAGGSLSVTSKEFYGFKFGATFSTTNSLFNINENSNAIFLSSDNRGVSLLSEGYATGNLFRNTAMIVGRKFIDTPFADTDDWGMIQNSFEVYLLQNSDIENLTVTAGRVTEMAGVDASVPAKFTKLNRNDGVNILGANYTFGDSGVEAQGWYYNAPDVIDLAYADFSTELNLNDSMDLAIGGQVAMQSADGGDDNIVFGAEASLSLPSNITVIGALNIAVGDLTVSNGFGGGPFYTSVEQNTISCGGKEAKAFATGVEYELSDKILLTAIGSLIQNSGSDSLAEVDLTGGYTIDEDSSVDIIFSQYDTFEDGDNSKGDTVSNTNIRVFYNHTF